MQTNQQVLSTLRTHYTEAELASVLGRLLRVPEAWEALRNPVFLEEVAASNPPAHLTPSHLAALALGGELNERIQVELAAPHAQRAERLWQQATGGSSPASELFETALIGLRLVQELSQDPSLIEQMVQDPARWRSPLCVAWPAITGAESMLAQLLDAGAYRLAMQLALANLPTEEAASYLARNANGSTVALLLELWRAGELGLAHSMSLPKASSAGHLDGSVPLLLQAIGSRSQGETEIARGALSQAWDAAAQATAHIADFTADLAAAEGDTVTELEANQRALEAIPSAARRARTAHSLAQLDRTGEAMALLSSPEPSIEELIVLGCLQTDSQQFDVAAQTLQQAAERLGSQTQLELRWYTDLAQALERCGELERALGVSQMQVRAFPASAAVRHHLAVELVNAGDREASAAQAELAVALAPQETAYRHTLAQTLDKLGRFDQALANRQLLPDPDPKALAETAVKAGQLELAGSLVEQMLTDDQGSAAAHLTLGRILAAKGEHASASAAFQEALRLDPQNTAAHLALAAWQQSTQDFEAAGQTLRQASQLDPTSPAVHAQLADWMAAMGRGSEALDAAAKAVELAPETIDYKLVHAQLLSSLGHHDQALVTLQSARQQAPRDWKIGLAIAEVHEKSGQARWAAQQLPQLPDSADATDWLAAGRIGVEAGADVNAALIALDHAEHAGCKDASLDYWYGRGLEQLERYEQAIERYTRSLAAAGPAAVDAHEQASLGLARCELRRGRISAALSVLDEARTTLGGGSRVLALTAQVYRSAKLLDKAVEVAQQAVEADPRDPAGWEALSGALAAAGDFEGAFSAAEQHDALDPSAVAAWLEIGRLAHQAEQHTLSRRSLAQAAWRARNDPPALSQVAEAMAEIGLTDTAVRAMKSAVRRKPEDPALLHAMAELYENSGRLEPALVAWQAYAAAVPTDEQGLRRAAGCAEQLGRSVESIELLERAQAVNPKSPGLRRRLASAYVAHGQADRGIRAYSQALRESPNDVSLAMEAAEAALRAGAAREALGFVGKAQQLAADEGRVQAALGEGYLLLNERERAAAALEKAIEHGESTGRILGMLSIVRPDQASAEQALSQANAGSAHDAIWMARAHTRLLAFDPAIELLTSWNSVPSAALELARTLLRMRDAAWLLGYADAAPPSPADLDQQAVERLIEDLQGQQSDPTAMEQLTAWQQAVEQPEALAAHVAHDPGGELGEALVVAYLKHGQTDQAAQALQQLKDVNPDSAWLGVLQGISDELAGQPEQARSTLRKAIDGGPLSPIAEYLVGRSYARTRSYQRAAGHIGKAAAKWMEQAAWQHKLGEIYLELQDPDSALGHFQSAVTVDPANNEYQIALAKTFQACGHLMQAEAAYRQAMANGSSSAEAYRLAGEVSLQLGRADEAVRRFEQACELAPDDPLAHVGAANAAAAIGNKQLAEKHLRAATQLDPEMPEVLVGQGQVLMLTGKSAAAMEAFERALQAGADPAQVHRYQSKLLLKRGDADQALRSLRQAIEANPEDDATWHELALALEAQSDLSAADQAIGQALRIAPRNPEYRLTLARISRRSGNLDRALEQLHQARKTVPDDPRLAVETGLVHEDRREYSRALDSYREAIEIDSSCLEAYYRAGLLLRTLKAYRRAGEMLKRAAELAPINSDVLHQLAAVRALELVHG